MENWILVKNLDGEVIKVRQHIKYSNIFVDENGKEYKASHLDFTKTTCASGEITKDNHFNELKEMMKSWDVKEQDNNRALIAEREYWRKLRGDIYMSIYQYYTQDCHAFTMTKKIVDTLYEQDKEFNNHEA